MQDILTDDDHARGCPANAARCTCGYDRRVEAEMHRLRRKVEELEAALEELRPFGASPDPGLR